MRSSTRHNRTPILSTASVLAILVAAIGSVLLGSGVAHAATPSCFYGPDAPVQNHVIVNPCGTPTPISPGPTVTLTSSDDQVAYGAAVTFTASVPQGYPGTIDFSYNQGVPLGSVQLSNQTASVETPDLPAGDDVVTAEWNPTPTEANSTSSTSMDEYVLPSPTVQTTQSNIAFGTVPIGSTDEVEIGLTNVGDSSVPWYWTGYTTTDPALSIDTTIAGNLNPECYTLTAYPGLQAGQTCLIELKYDPTELGNDAATITIDGGTPNQVILSATGTAAPLTPVVTSISPASGPVSGGTKVTLSGLNLQEVTGITVGGIAVKRGSCPTSTKCVFYTPAGKKGTSEILVTNVTGTSGSVKSAQFRYVK